MPKVKMIPIYADLIDLSPQNLAKPRNERTLLIRTQIGEIIDLSEQKMIHKA